MDPDHLGYLLDRYLPALVLYARQWCRAPEDVVQEAFIKLARQAEPPRETFYTDVLAATGEPPDGALAWGNAVRFLEGVLA